MKNDNPFLDFDDYQHKAISTLKHGSVSHLGFGLMAEAGEVSTLLQKYFRHDPAYRQPDLFDGDGFTPEFREKMYKELGDVIWYTACLADYFGFPLSAVVNHNVKKLQKRQEEGKIHGDGDNR